MRDAVLTIRMPGATRRRLQTLARREGRSLSAQAERLIEQGLNPGSTSAASRRGARPLAGLFRGQAVPTFADFRAVRHSLSASLQRRIGARAKRRR